MCRGTVSYGIRLRRCARQFRRAALVVRAHDVLRYMGCVGDLQHKDGGALTLDQWSSPMPPHPCSSGTTSLPRLLCVGCDGISAMPSATVISKDACWSAGSTSIILPCSAGSSGMPLSSTSGVAAISPRQPTRTNHNHHGEYARHKAHPTQGFDDLLSHPLSLSEDCFGLFTAKTGLPGIILPAHYNMVIV